MSLFMLYIFQFIKNINHQETKSNNNLRVLQILVFTDSLIIS